MNISVSPVSESKFPMETGYIIFHMYIFLFIYLFSIWKGKVEKLREDIVPPNSILHWKITPTGKTEKYIYQFVQKGSMTR